MSQTYATQLNECSIDQKPASILVVDDEKTLRLVLCRAMEREGYSTIVASSGESCLFLCQQQLPDLILMDAVMPGMDGLECCERLQAMFGSRCPAILIITALYDQETVDRAFAAGASDYITKPIHWAILRQRVRRLLSNSQLNAQWQALLMREQALKDQLETQTRQVQYLTQLCQSLTQ